MFRESAMRFPSSATTSRLFIIGMAFVYTILYLHTPLRINATYPHDDTLYMSLGRSLAEGHWLGRYNEFTLMKGPGYPLFLAIANWLGISVSLAHALFHCGAVMFFVAIAHRFMKSFLLSGLLFVLLLWHPIALGPFLLRIIRESIQYGQVLIFLAAFACTLLCTTGWKERAFYGALSGAAFGWFWLTREDSVWLAPAIAILLAAGALRAFRERTLRELAGAVIVVIAVFGATQVAFRSVNWWVYGKFVSVDVKETNFQRAMGALQSVLSGGNQPFVPVSRAARERIYAISPSFASLAIHLDRGVGAAYDSISCPLQPTTCGNIGSSVFIWALRDAASRAGHYASPAKASEFFGRIADDVTQACKRGALECNPQFIAEIPQVYREQFAQLPQGYVKVLGLLLMLKPPVLLNPSLGTEEELAPHLRFLHYPLHTKSTDSLPPAAFKLLGWYYKSGRSWMMVTASSAANLRFERLDSPDIAAGFKDTDATRQRYSIEGRCSIDCTLRFETPDGDKVEKKLGELARPPVGFDLGPGRVHVDAAEIQANEYPLPTLAENVARQLRERIVTSYNYLFIPVLVAGIVAMLLSTLLYLKRAIYNPCYALAVALWVAVFTRVTMLVVIEATWIPPIFSGHSPYLTPLYFLIVSAAVLSIAAWTQLRATPQHMTHHVSNETASA